MYGKIDRYLLIAVVIIGLACLYFLFTGNKKDNDRDSLLLQMARKLGASDFMEEEYPEKKSQGKQQSRPEPTEEEEEVYITSIADKLCFSKPLDAQELEFQKRFSKEINDELANSKKVLAILVNKFMTDVKEFDTFEKEFYEANKEEIDQIINNHKLRDSVIQKLLDGKNDFTAEELQFQQTYASYIEQELAKRKQPPVSLQGANPPMAADQRLKVILSLFEDKVPKTVTQITELYAELTSTKPHTGNRSVDLGKMVDDGLLKCTKAGKDKKVYHGPPDWFEGKLLKEEYKQNIPK